jgi:CBS domain-containing protein
MNYVRHILQAKGNETLAIEPSASAQEALKLMIDHNIGSLAVVQDDNLVGLFTERDFAKSVSADGKSAFDRSVGEIMTREVLYVSLATTIEQCMALMTEKRTRHLPVLENGKLVGIVSIGDVVKRLIADKDFMIEQMERYITGGY